MASSTRGKSLSEFITCVRRNHALEHATIHILSSRHPKSTIVGRSDQNGFFLYTRLPKTAVEEGVQIALDRLRAGDHRLAIHPNCGTNLLTAGMLSGLAAYLTVQSSHEQNPFDKLKRLPLAIMSATLGLIIAQPLGAKAQKYLTTKADPGPLEIVSVNSIRSMKGHLYRVLTRQ